MDFGSEKPTETSRDTTWDSYCFCYIKQDLISTARSHSSSATGQISLFIPRTTDPYKIRGGATKVTQPNSADTGALRAISSASDCKGPDLGMGRQFLLSDDPAPHCRTVYLSCRRPKELGSHSQPSLKHRHFLQEQPKVTLNPFTDCSFPPLA